jgi:uncharacterized membrane protein YeiH
MVHFIVGYFCSFRSGLEHFQVINLKIKAYTGGALLDMIVKHSPWFSFREPEESHLLVLEPNG